jgi:hypothetical protein
MGVGEGMGSIDVDVGGRCRCPFAVLHIGRDKERRREEDRFPLPPPV